VTGAAATTAADAGPLHCGNCRQPMQRLALRGHYGRTVEIDLCGACHLVWFDQAETARLTGAALLDLIGRMAETQTLPHEPLRRDAGCARCGGPLKTVHNRSRWGRSLQLECLRGHGAYQTFAQFLQEKGLLRPMSRIDRARLAESGEGLACVNCGAHLGRDDEHCSHCLSVPSLLDVARLARALDPEGAVEPQPVHAAAPQRGALQCAACGAALPPDQALRCAQCGATLAISRLAEAHRSVRSLSQALHAHAQKPAPHVVKRRLEALDADLPRRREWAADMEAQAQRRRGHFGDADDEAFEWSSLLGRRTNPLRALLIALAVWFLWRYWG
jgi:hypothetical protein